MTNARTRDRFTNALLAAALAVGACSAPSAPATSDASARKPAAVTPAAASPAAVPAPENEAPSAALLERYARVKARAPAGFTVLLEPPFVVAGDEAPRRVKLRAVNTVRFAVTRLERDFFEATLRHPIAIWLFRDAESYAHHARALFGETPETPYGYYSATHRALVMNIATGGGTLVHEIVHPYVEADFPGCPTWIDEGLGSLFEQCADRDGHLRGLTNWRLPGLQKAIRAGRLPPFDELVATTREEFYGADPGTNYGQARYLMYYLQEHGLLVRFYRAARDGHAGDPTGARALRAVLGREDLAEFQREWEAWVLELEHP